MTWSTAQKPPKPRPPDPPLPPASGSPPYRLRTLYMHVGDRIEEVNPGHFALLSGGPKIVAMTPRVDTSKEALPALYYQLDLDNGDYLHVNARWVLAELWIQTQATEGTDEKE